METSELLPCCGGLTGVQSMIWIILTIPVWLLSIAGCTLVFWGVLEYLIWRVGEGFEKERKEQEEDIQ